MNKYDVLRNQLDTALFGAKTDIAHLHTIAAESGRVSETTRNAPTIIADLDRKFEQVTKLNGIDITFLFFAIALQVARQYFVTNFKERSEHDDAAKGTKHFEEKTLGKESKAKSLDRKNSTHQWYQPSLQEVMFNPVPFDQTAGSKIMGIKLGGAFEHRAKTLGHDPILGYIFGTANIATATLTAWNGQSFHVKYVAGRPTITNNADTLKVFTHTKDRLIDEGVEGKVIVGVSLFREVMHLQSDIYSKVSLPIPIASPTISPDAAKQLAEYGLDMANVLTVGKQALYAALINTLIAMVHRLLFDESRDGSLSLYEVKTRKILSYSNVIASASNLIVVALGAKYGDKKKALQHLDIGGLLVALYRIITDYQFIKKVKQEFLEKEFYNIVMGDEYNF
jgi:hypothetical protein